MIALRKNTVFLLSMLGAFLLAHLLFLPVASADSPVTSTPFSNAYLDMEMVQKARLLEGVMDEEIAHFLAQPEISLEEKAAVINSLYNYTNVWEVRKNAGIYTGFIYKADPEQLDLQALAADQLFVIGYLTLLDDYFYPQKSLPFLDLAVEKMPSNFTAALIKALAEMQQHLLHSEGENIWLRAKKIISKPGLEEDRLREEALTTILDYLYLYRSPQDDVSIFLNNALLYGAEPVIVVKGRTLIPWQDLCRGLGAKAEWNEEHNKVTITKDNISVILELKSDVALVNGEPHHLDQQPVALDDRFLLPLRFVSETLGADVHWDDKNRSVEISILSS